MNNNTFNEEFDKIQEVIVSMESLAKFCDGLLASKTLTMDLAMESEVVTGNNKILETYFARWMNSSKYSIAVESVVDNINSTLKKFFRMIAELIKKTATWFDEKIKNARTRFASVEAGKTIESIDWRFRDEMIQESTQAKDFESELEGYENQWKDRFNGLHRDMLVTKYASKAIKKLCETVRRHNYEHLIQGSVNDLLTWHAQAAVATTDMLDKDSDRWMNIQFRKDKDHDELVSSVEESLPKSMDSFEEASKEIASLTEDVKEDLDNLANAPSGFTQPVVKYMTSAEAIGRQYKDLGIESVVSNTATMKIALATLDKRIGEVAKTGDALAENTEANAHAKRITMAVNAIVMRELRNLVSSFTVYAGVIQVVSATVQSIITAELTLVMYYKGRLRIYAEQTGFDRQEIIATMDVWEKWTTQLRNLLDTGK